MIDNINQLDKCNNQELCNKIEEILGKMDKGHG
jgi:hypothetical protein